MASLIDLSTFTDQRGSLTVIEKVVPFPILRLFYIYGVDHSMRGGHRHKTTRQAAVCLQGSCRVFCNNGKKKEFFVLDGPGKCLFIEPEDWHTMDQFSSDAILMVLASTYYDYEDYIFEPYKND